MWIDSTRLSPEAHYRWLNQTIVPRPIAWILTRHANGSCNLAPFSFFNVVADDPPIVSVSIGRRADGTKKDTLANLEREGYAMFHLPAVAHLDAVNQSAAPLAPGESEVAAQQLELIECPGLPLPRLAGVQVAFLTRLLAVHEVGREPQGLALCEVTHLFLDDALGLTSWDERQRLDVARLDPLARLGGTEFSAIGERFSRQRPSVKS